jgi:hypothetical protein
VCICAKCDRASLTRFSQVVELDSTYKERLRALQIRSYFYGGSASASRPEGEGEASSATLPGHAEPLGGLPALSPLTTSIPFDLLEIYRVGQGERAVRSISGLSLLTRLCREHGAIVCAAHRHGPHGDRDAARQA